MINGDYFSYTDNNKPAKSSKVKSVTMGTKNKGKVMEFKVGDRVKRINSNGNRGFNVGVEATVMTVHTISGIRVKLDNGKESWGNDRVNLELVNTIDRIEIGDKVERLKNAEHSWHQYNKKGFQFTVTKVTPQYVTGTIMIGGYSNITITVLKSNVKLIEKKNGTKVSTDNTKEKKVTAKFKVGDKIVSHYSKVYGKNYTSYDGPGTITWVNSGSVNDEDNREYQITLDKSGIKYYGYATKTFVAASKFDIYNETTVVVKKLAAKSLTVAGRVVTIGTPSKASVAANNTQSVSGVSGNFTVDQLKEVSGFFNELADALEGYTTE